MRMVSRVVRLELLAIRVIAISRRLVHFVDGASERLFRTLVGRVGVPMRTWLAVVREGLRNVVVRRFRCPAQGRFDLAHMARAVAVVALGSATPLAVLDLVKPMPRRSSASRSSRTSTGTTYSTNASLHLTHLRS